LLERKYVPKKAIIGEIGENHQDIGIFEAQAFINTIGTRAIDLLQGFNKKISAKENHVKSIVKVFQSSEHEVLKKHVNNLKQQYSKEKTLETKPIII
jgi:hypothetical protein